jgi:hypothetical protein
VSKRTASISRPVEGETYVIVALSGACVIEADAGAVQDARYGEMP